MREPIKYGADFIKVYGTHHFRFTPEGKPVSAPTFSAHELVTIVDEAIPRVRKLPATPMATLGSATVWTPPWIRRSFDFGKFADLAADGREIR